MRVFVRCCALPVLVAMPVYAASIVSDVGALSPPRRQAADSTPVAVRWNRLVPSIIEADAASRRAARAAAADDSAAMRKLALQPRQPLLMRVYAMLSVAQYAAAISVRGPRTATLVPAVPSASAAALAAATSGGGRGSAEIELAVASASAGVLAGLYVEAGPRALIARELSRDVERARARSRGQLPNVMTSATLGESIARRILADAPALDIAAPWGGTIPTGPGKWFSAPGVPPLGIRFATTRPWLLDAPAQFRPTAPPTFGSDVWRAALEEVRQVASARTPEQTAIAQKWNSGDPWAPWNEIASAEIRRHRMSESDAARVLAVMNASAADAMIACFDAKYHYWTIRRSQADTTLAASAEIVSLPNFPSFPSGHACSAGAFDATLGHFFPAARAMFTRVAEEQAMSRLYGTVHYRFDNDVGLALGRTVARYAVKRERQGGLNVWRTDAGAAKR